MSKHDLRVGFIDYCPTVDEYFIHTLSRVYNVIRDDKDPDVLFFMDETFGTSNRVRPRGREKRIFYTGENRRPQNYDADFYLTFDHLFADNHFRLPLYVLDDFVNRHKLGLPSLDDVQNDRNNRQHAVDTIRPNFCSWVVSNGHSGYRNHLFSLINSYKTVRSGGTFMNNVGAPIPRGENAQAHKVKFFETSKFVLALENSSYPGYVTEKITHAYISGCVPIYWGSPTLGMDFNPDSYVSRNDFHTDKEFMEYLKYLDKSNDEYLFIRNQPPFTAKYHARIKDWDMNFLSWFGQVVMT